MYGAPSYTYNPQYSAGPAHLPPSYGTGTPVKGGAVYLAGHAANRVVHSAIGSLAFLPNSTNLSGAMKPLSYGGFFGEEEGETEEDTNGNENGDQTGREKWNAFVSNPAVQIGYTLLTATAMAYGYKRAKDQGKRLLLLRAFGAGLVSVPYLVYVYIDTRK